ncbi:MAG: hypothetical protein CXX80_02775, partial [Methanobacteriota archaeon]
FAVEMLPFVIFSNRNLVVPDSVKAREDCWSLADILDYLPKSGGVDPSKDGLSVPHAALAATLDRLGSWDTLHHYGGQQTIGDIYSISENSGHLASLFKQHRERITKIKILADRSLWKAIIKRPTLTAELFDEEGMFEVCGVEPGGCLNYRGAGSRQRKTLEWRHIAGMELTSRIVDDEDGVPRAPTDYSKQ